VSFTYVDPLTIPRDAVRLLVGDTVSVSALFQDSEIDYFLSLAGNSPPQAALLALDTLASRFSNQVDISVGKLSISSSERSQAYAERAAAMRKRIGTSGARILVGGGTWSRRAEVLGGNDCPINPLVWDRWS
jgi:hypothetical protein